MTYRSKLDKNKEICWNQQAIHYSLPSSGTFITGIHNLAFNWARIATNRTNLWLFKICFLFILAQWAEINRKLIYKSPRFVPFGANLSKLESKSDIPDSVNWHIKETDYNCLIQMNKVKEQLKSCLILFLTYDFYLIDNIDFLFIYIW